MDRLRPSPIYARLNDYIPQQSPDYIHLSTFKSDTSSKLKNDASNEYSSGYYQQADSTETSSARRFSEVKIGGRSFSGWRFGALSGAMLAIISLLINLIAIIWLSTHKNNKDGLVEVFNGDCQKVKVMNTWAHFAINVISTLLLGGSNYSMQCLVAPTRDEIDKEHAKGRFLDIGVPSVRNLSKVPKYKMVLWWILGLSSVPLHLFYNSAFYSAIAALDYDVFIASPAFISGGSFNLSTITDYDEGQTVVNLTTVQNEISTYKNLTNSDCIKEYGQIISTELRTLVIISSTNITSSNSLKAVVPYEFREAVDPNSGYAPFAWICSDPNLKKKITLPSPWDLPYSGWPSCDVYVSKVRDISSEWAPYGYQADYCLSQPGKQKCSFNGNVPIIGAVVACNAIKAFVMLLVAFKLAGRPLITIGDAIESFLQKPDPTTKGICWISRRDVNDFMTYSQHFPDAPFPMDKFKTTPDGKELSTRKRKWFNAAGDTRWTITILLFLVALGVTGGLLSLAVTSIEDIANMGHDAIKNMGFGLLQPVAIISGWAIDQISVPANQILASVLIANLPQVILSFLYLNLNGLVTAMWLAAEWNDFATRRRYLRVSNPQGQQRSTHFLQLPYKVAIPLMIMSGLLHWTISQSIFLAVVSEYDENDVLYNPVEIASCGFSVMAIIVTMCLAFCIVSVTIAIGFRKYDGRIPLVGSCSAAISAACHRPEWDHDAALQPVQYGVLNERHIDQDPTVGHCCFTSGDVTFIEEGKKYAGIMDGR